ncbi:MAG: transporter substrate-binding domain-containing protein [bacterium]
MKSDYPLLYSLIFVLSINFSNNIYGLESAHDHHRTIVVGTELNYPPYSYLNEDDRPIGMNIDLINAVAEVLGIEVKIEIDEWNIIYDKLETDQIDVIAGMFYSPERDLNFDFTQPFEVIQHAIFARENAQEDVKFAGDNLKNKKLIVMRDDIMHDFVKNKNIDPANYLITPTLADALRKLSGGEQQYALGAYLPGLYWIDKYNLTNLKVLKSDFHAAKYCFAVREGSNAIQAHFADALLVLKNTGKLQEIYEKWHNVVEVPFYYSEIFNKYLIIFIISFLVISLIVISWFLSLRREVSRRTASLKKQGESLRSTLSSMDDLVFSLNIDEIITEYKPPISENVDITNYLGKHLKEVFPDKIASQFEKAILKIKNDNSIEQIEYNYQTNLTSRWYIAKISPKLHKREQVGFTVVAREITQRKLNEKEVLESEKILREISNCFLSFTGDARENINKIVKLTGKLMNADSALYHKVKDEMLYPIAGWNLPPDIKEKDTANGHVCYDVVNRAKDKIFHVANLQESSYVDSDPNVSKYKLGGYIAFPVKSTDGYLGTLCAVYHETVELKKDHENIMAILSNAVGVEESRLKAEEEYRKFKSIADKANYGTAIVDMGGNILYINEYFAHQHGYKPEELIGTPVSTLYTENELKKLEQVKIHLFKYGFYAPIEVLQKRKDGTTFPVLISGTLIYDYEHRPQYMTATAIDLSEMKKLQRQILHNSKLASIGLLSAGVGHEINNPLQIISGNVELMKMKLDPNCDVYTYLCAVQDATMRIKNIVDGLRSFARIDSEQVEVIDVHEVIDQSLQLVETIYAKKNLEIKTNYKSKKSCVEGNKGKLQQIIMNLLSNSSDAMENQRGVIKIETSNDENHLQIEFRDNGKGIKEEYLDKIFDSFFTTKEVGKGTGLGLGITHSIVESMNGKIKVDSELGKGTCFTISFPLAGKPAKIAPYTIQIIDEWKVSGKVLIVDDEENIRIFLSQMLSSLGLDTYLAADGEEACQKIEKEKFDYIITDLQMPKMKGYELIERIAKADINTNVIIITGGLYKETPRQKELKDKYVKGVLNKPFNKDDVIEILKNIK